MHLSCSCVRVAVFVILRWEGGGGVAVRKGTVHVVVLVGVWKELCGVMVNLVWAWQPVRQAVATGNAALQKCRFTQLQQPATEGKLWDLHSMLD